MDNCYLLTSESVAEGHPDKVADQISDAILDAVLTEDANGRVAAETLIRENCVILAGEITTNAKVDFESVVRRTLKQIGYDNSNYGIDYNSCLVLQMYTEQSSDIAQGVNISTDTNSIGAGDQGLMFGYACDETPTFMPATIYYAHRVMERVAKLRKNNELPYLRPDGKCQLTFKYQNGQPIGIEKIIISVQHDPNQNDSSRSFKTSFYTDIVEKIICGVLPTEWIPRTANSILINPTGRFVVGGPKGDCGLTGRKIIVDTYGGICEHGGGAFSGKDPTKVDRSAAYMARYLAKNIVASGVTKKCKVQLSYAIGVSQPLSVSVYTNVDNNSLGLKHNSKLVEIIKKNFDLTPQGIINTLNLKRPIYQKTASYGHFGREDVDFSWETLDCVEKFAQKF